LWSEQWPCRWYLRPDGLPMIVIDKESPWGYSQNAPFK